MPISLRADLSSLGKLETKLEKDATDLHAQIKLGLTDLTTRITERVRHDIRSAGNFGAKWTDAFHVEVRTYESNVVTVIGVMDNPFWTVFQYGKTITGKPWLWFKPAPGRIQGDPKVIKVRQVTIPKKFHIKEIIAEETTKAGDIIKGAVFNQPQFNG
jgi:hypothetical protein